MAKRRLYISIGLMLLAIVAIIAFQSYWLHKNFKEEEQTLKLRTNVLLRDAIHQIQVAKLTDDSVFVQGYGKTDTTHSGGVSQKKTPAPRVAVKDDKQKGAAIPLDPSNIKSVQIDHSNIIIRTEPGHVRRYDTSLLKENDSIAHRISNVVIRAMTRTPNWEGDTTIRLKRRMSPEEAIRFGLPMPDSGGTTFVRIDSNGKRVERRLPPSVTGVVSYPADAKYERRNDSTILLRGRVAARNVQRARVFSDRTGGFNFVQILKSTESLKDTITIKELSDTLQLALIKEGLRIPFHIIRRDVPDEIPMRAELEQANEVVVGYTYPFIYKLELPKTVSYILKKLLPQIVVSVLLVGLTVLSFVLLLRNLVQQRKLTQLKNDFISNITHELKTPIATVSVAIEALKNFNALNDPKRTSEYLDISGNELQRLSLLVDKVLKLSMFEKQQIELRYENFNMQQLVEEVVSSMRLQFEKYKAKINVNLQGDNFILKGDRLHLTSVLFNLLDNALKYGKANPSIQIELIDRANELEMSVTDNGIGISPEYRKKIFDKFFRVPTGDTHNVKGYGLGLSYVAYVVKRHNGQMDVESQPGIGSRFIIKLPRTTHE
ncbi:MAG: HAMP domain-containing sensor histidine kinase [Chitinophagaceae bacterium]